MLLWTYGKLTTLRCAGNELIGITSDWWFSGKACLLLARTRFEAGWGQIELPQIRNR